jgi:hypothetical protein
MALITVCPVASRATDNAVDSPPQLVAPRAANECPLTQPADPAGCANGGFGPPATAGALTSETKGDQGANDASGELLENLVGKAAERDHK